MASETGPDLSSAREAMEALMDDACVIVRPPTESAGVLNTGTGVLVEAVPATVYDATTVGDGSRSLADEDGLGGKLTCSPDDGGAPRVGDEGGVRIVPRWYKASLPWDAPRIEIGDLLTVVSSRRDPELPDTELIVRDVKVSTYLVARKLKLERR